MPSLNDLIRPDIANLEPYTPIIPPDMLARQLGIPAEQIIKLDANENPYGPAPGVIEALVAGAASFAIYPDPQHTRLREALADYTGQPMERILCGAGADELIDLLLRLLLLPGDAVINCPPTFGMYAFDTAVCGGRLVEVQRREDFSLNVALIERVAAETGAKVLFLTSPNNPDGSLIPPEEVERLLRLPLLVVVDEAYIEFTGKPQGLSEWVGRYENLVVLRTFSKWAGLAGLRVGYGLMPEAIAEHLWKMKQPYNVNVAADIAAVASLGEHLEYLRSNIARIVVERERMLKALKRVPALRVYPSHTNFILCRVVVGSALHIKQELAHKGILVRYYNKPDLNDCIRISIGKPAQNDALLDALEALGKNDER